MFSMRKLFTTQIMLSNIRTKLYNEIFDRDQIFHMTKYIDFTEKHTNDLIFTLIFISSTCLFIELFYNYKVEKIKHTDYYKKIEREIEIFLFLVMFIFFRNIENAI